MKSQTIDELCGVPEGTFKAFCEAQSESYAKIEVELKERLRKSSTLFECPKCYGLHFNITNGGKLVCSNRSKYTNYELKDGGCGWSGRVPESYI